jgi:pyruvate formate lyase activating enzyme
MLDWPGKMASTIFTAGCNFRCPFCHNGELVINADDYEDIDPVQLVSYLSSRRLWVEHAVITGGEPLLQRDIVPFVRMLKNIDMKVKIDTNGTRPKKLEELLQDELVDFVAMDFKGPFRLYPEIVRMPVDVDSIKRSIEIIVASGKPYEFRMTVAPTLLRVEDILEAASELKQMGAEKFVLQQFQNKGTLDPGFEKLRPYQKSVLEDAAYRISKFMEVEIRGV